MRPIEKTANDLFQKLRSRFSPVTLGDEKSESTTEPSEARFFNLIYKEGEDAVGPISISLVDGRGMKVFYGEQIVDAVQDKAAWYGFLKELREFAKRNLLTFDARDLAKDQLDSRDFNWLSKADGTMKEKDVNISESMMYGSKRRSYQAFESVKIIVQHSKSVDEAVPGARSRSIHGIYLERSDGERYKFPYNYLTGARAMARHVSEGGTPYDDLGKHILGMIGEMRDLSKFARMTRSHAMEDEAANDIRSKIVERYQGLKATLGAMSNQNGYKTYTENYKPSDADANGKLDEIKEIFTKKVWDQKMEQLLPAVGRALASSKINEASPSVERMVKDPNKLLVLKADPAADQMLRKAKFTDAMGLMGFILSDIASRAIGDDMDPLANFASDVADRLGDRELDPKDKQLAMLLSKRYMDDIKKMATDPEYTSMVRKDPSDIYGKKKKREGGFHEAEAYEAWANDVVKVDEADHDWAMDWMESGVARSIFRRIQMQHADLLSKYGLDKVLNAVQDQVEFVGDVEEIGSSDVSAWVNQIMRSLSVDEATTQGTAPTQGTQDPRQKANIAQAAKNVSRVTKAAGIQTPPGVIAQGMAAQQAGKMPGKQTMQTIGGLGNTIMQAAASDPRKAAALTAMMRKMVTQGKFDEAAVRDILEAPLAGAPAMKNPTQRAYDPKNPSWAGAGVAMPAAGAQAVNRDLKTDLLQPPPVVNRAAKTDLIQPQTVNRAAKTDMLPTAPAPTSSVTVQKGDTMWDLYTKQYGKAPTMAQLDKIAKASGIKNKDLIMPGQKIVFNSQEDDAEPVMEKELSVKDDQDGDGDSDFADVMVARRVKSGEPKDKAISATKNKPYNEADINEDKLMSESLQLLKVLAGI